MNKDIVKDLNKIFKTAFESKSVKNEKMYLYLPLKYNKETIKLIKKGGPCACFDGVVLTASNVVVDWNGKIIKKL